MLTLLVTAVALVAPVAEPRFTFERFHTTDEIRETFVALAAAHPRWFRASSLGTSVRGVGIPVLSITDRHVDRPKAGMWIDGAIHGHELASAEPPLGVVEELRARISRGEAPEFLTRVVLHVVPVLNVDARQLSISGPGLRQRRNLAPVDDDGDGRVDEDGPVDVNGDGRIGMMRFLHADGTRGARPEELDQDEDGRCGEDPPGGIDLNRNFPVHRDPGDVDGGPVQPETEAVMAFWDAHPEIELAVSYHTSTNLYVLPPVALSDEDRRRFEPFLQIYRDATGFAEYVVDPPRFRGLSVEWFWQQHDAVAFIIEIDRDGPPLERAVDEVLHPCYGPVEVPIIEDGWMYECNTYLERELPTVVAETTAYLLAMARRLAREE